MLSVVPGLRRRNLFRAQDKELALLCLKAWNDFYIDEWCGTAPDRFVPMAILPVWDIDLTCAEAERVIAKGARTFSFPDSPQPLGLPSFYTNHWDPLWQICSAAEVPVSLHFGSGSYVPGFPFQKVANGPEVLDQGAPFVVAMILFSSNLMWTTVDLLFSGALQRFPKLQFSLAEGGIGWIPYLLERCDYGWERHRYYQDIDFDADPPTFSANTFTAASSTTSMDWKTDTRSASTTSPLRWTIHTPTRTGRIAASALPRC